MLAIAASMGWGGKPRSSALLPTIVRTRSMWIESSFDPIQIESGLNPVCSADRPVASFLQAG